MALSAAACSEHQEEDSAPADWLARLDQEVLTLSDVAAAMPAGMSEEDSVRFVKAFVNSWIDSHLIENVAAEEVDMATIDRMVEDYRRNLIVNFYRRGMFETHVADIPEDSILAYYEANRNRWKLERPMLKGIYLKLPVDARNLRTIRRLYASNKTDDIDRLEKEVLSSAIHYDYFRNRWVDWEQIENKIPADFGNDPDTWLKSHKSLDITSGGFVYLLSISDVMPAGSVAPVEAVRSDIIDLILRSDRQAYNARLDNQLREHALSSGRLEIRDQGL